MKLKSRQSQATTAETDKIVLLKSWLTLNVFFLYENKTKQINSGVVCAKVRFHFDNDRFTMFSLKKTIQKKNYDVINCYKLSWTSIDSLVDSTKQTIIINFNWCRDKTKCNKCTNLRLAVIILALETDLFYLFGQLINVGLIVTYIWDAINTYEGVCVLYPWSGQKESHILFLSK